MVNFAIYALWFALPPLQGAIAFRMWRQKSYRDYPLFFAYTLEQLVRFAVLFYYSRLPVETPYRHAYAAFQAVEAILQIGIICELFSDVLRPYEGIRHIGPSLLRWASVFFLFAAIVVAAYSTGADSSKSLSNLYAMERSVEIVQAGLLLLLALTSMLLALEWKPRTLWIALGFGLFSGVDLIVYTIRYQTGLWNESTLNLISSAAFDLSVLMWIGAFFFQPAFSPQRDLPQSGLEFSSQKDSPSPPLDVQSWNKALLQLLRR